MGTGQSMTIDKSTISGSPVRAGRDGSSDGGEEAKTICVKYLS